MRKIGMRRKKPSKTTPKTFSYSESITLAPIDHSEIKIGAFSPVVPILGCLEKGRGFGFLFGYFSLGKDRDKNPRQPRETFWCFRVFTGVL